MDVVRLVLLCVAAALVAAMLRVDRPEMAAAVAMAAGTVALLMAAGNLKVVVDAARALAGGAGVSGESTQIMLRAAGIALIAEFGAQLSRDAGESALAGRIELGARVALAAMSVPLITGLVTKLASLMP
jgi:stage III sporulation protein AD